MSHFALVTPAKAGVLSLPSRTQTPLSPGKGRATSGGGVWVNWCNAPPLPRRVPPDTPSPAKGTWRSACPGRYRVKSPTKNVARFLRGPIARYDGVLFYDAKTRGKRPARQSLTLPTNYGQVDNNSKTFLTSSFIATVTSRCKPSIYVQ